MKYRIASLFMVMTQVVMKQRQRMGYFFYLVSCFFIAANFMNVAFAQDLAQPGSPKKNAIDSVGKYLSHFDQFPGDRIMDSVNTLTNLNRLTDSLKVVNWADSMRYKIDRKYTPQVKALNRKMDSLRGYSLPTAKVKAKMDRLVKKQSALIGEVREKQTALQSSVSSRYSSWQTSLRRRLKLDSMGVNQPNTSLGQKIPGAQNPLNQIKLPNKKLSLQTGAGSGSLPMMPTLSQQDFATLNLSKDLKKLGGPLSMPGTAQLKQWENTVPAIKELNTLKAQGASYKNVLKDPGTAAENAMTNLSEVAAVKKELPTMTQLNNNEAMQVANGMKSAEGMRSEGMKMATDHFAGKEKELKQAMDQMSTYKKKYESLPSLDEAKRRFWHPRNSLRGAPFIDRFRVGFNTGFRTSKDTLIVDLYPNVSYRLTGRLEAGFGGVYRIRALTNPLSVDTHSDNTWGAAGFVVVKTFKKTFVRVEADGSRYALTPSPDGTIQHAWRWTYLTGLQTTFTISRKLSGNIQMLYNFDHKLKDGFPERLVMRIGVQWRLR